MSQYLGDISAYALAVSQGYTGTEEEYAELMASYAAVGQTAVTAAQTATTKASEAATSATTATNKATEATTAATTATTKAAEAQADADAAALDASQAMSAASTATTKATEATTAAATATSAKTDAVAANTAAQSAKTAAQTAQTGAETAAASVQSSAAQIATNAADISQLKSEFTQLEDVLEIPTGEHISATSNKSWTVTTIGEMPLTNGVTYTFNFNVASAVVTGKVPFIYVKNAETGTNIWSAQIAVGTTSNEYVYTCNSDDLTVRFVFQVGVSDETTVNVDVTTNEVGRLDRIEETIANISESTTQQYILVNTALSSETKENSQSGEVAIYNLTYNRLGTATNATCGFDVYAVTKGFYKVRGYGIDTPNQPVAVLGNADIIENGASYCDLLQTFEFGNAESVLWRTATIKVEHDGYLYVNYTGDSGTSTVEKVTEVFNEATITEGIIKDGQTYTFVQPLPKGNYIARKFKQTGANALMDFAGLYFGSFSGGAFVAEKTIFEAYTDNIGPYSIGRNSAEGGSWAGGYHTVNVGGVDCPTAEQESLAVFVNGVDISNSADGFYAGNAIIEAINSIYFPQTITDNAFTDAGKAIEETRRFVLKDTLEVEVITKTLASVYVSMYYGLQMQTGWATNFIIPSEEALYAKTDISSDIPFMTKGHKLEAISDDVLVQMLLDDDGIGTYKYNNGTTQYGHIMANGAKIYFAQIYNTTFESGKCLYWSGKYKALQR